MRIPASKVYRAFPEFDRFSDEQCEGFLRAVARHPGRRAGRLLVQCLATLAALLVIGFLSSRLAVVIEDAVGRGPQTIWRDSLPPLVWLVTTLPLSGLVYLIVKDFLLRRAIARVMNQRGSCASCGYGLTGLPVQPDGRVICPECGQFVMADASLGEVLPDTGGQMLFMPSPDAVPTVKPWIRPKVRKGLLRVIGWGTLAGVLILALVAGGYELFLRRQAARARAMALTPAQVEAMALANQPGVSPHDPNAFEILMAALAEMEIIEAEHRTTSTAWGAGLQNTDFAVIYQPDEAYGNASPEDIAAWRAHVRTLLEAFTKAGVYGKLDDMAARPLAVRPAGFNQGQPVGLTSWMGLRSMFTLSAMNTARLHEALRARDQAEWLSAFEVSLAFSRMQALQPGLYNRTYSAMIDASTRQQLAAMLESDVADAWTPGAWEAWQRQAWDLPADRPFLDEKALMSDVIAMQFADPSNVRFGLYSAFGGMGNQWSIADWLEYDSRLGFLDENMQRLAERMDSFAAVAKDDPFARKAVPVWAASGLMLVDQWSGALGGSLTAIDDQRAVRRGMAVALALARHKAEHKRYPASLRELVPMYLPALPLDPWSGVSFAYRTDVAGQAVVLYSVGNDGTDNGGTAPAKPQGRSWFQPSTSTGEDLVIFRRGTP
ncbi:MAG: hypothetical protein HBSAPP03_20500 [Phycisphaerae bacterium]|nr:MAG: hypothetical protein HBSAPP03_20500 [Phycisphaerae bacterium]